MEPKRIDMQTGKFTANGVNYSIEQFLTIERYAEFQILEKEMAYGMTFEAQYKLVDAAEKALNKTNFVDAAVLLNNLKQGILKVKSREPVVLKICALFMNAENENIKIITQDMIDTKIYNWKHEGIAMNDFFTVALNSVNGFLGIYQSITRSITAILETPSNPKNEG
jgi:hypothetical protein